MKKNEGLNDEWMYDMFEYLMTHDDDMIDPNKMNEYLSSLKREKYKELAKFIFTIFAIIVCIAIIIVVMIYIGIPGYIRNVVSFVIGGIAGSGISQSHNKYRVMTAHLNQTIEDAEELCDLSIREAYEEEFNNDEEEDK